MNIRIAIAEDQALFRKGMIALLDSIKDFSVVAEAINGQDLLDQFKDLNKSAEGIPDITLLDLRMPELDGIKTTSELRKKYPDHKIIIVSAHDDADIIVHLYEKGVNAFLDKNADPDEVELAIRSVLKNDFYFNEDAREALEESNADEKNSIHLGIKDLLNDRDRDLLRLICQEKTAAEIGEELALSKKTVDNYRNRLLHKTKSKNITGLVLFAVRANIISVSELKINFI